ncbi:beta-galactosidase [Cerasicoccus frondis]|uniref:beta-galactosidase n=1 Tax=Cerasicoccus frondis TaxID=490090 RepID=UPI00285278B9|nr:beta-galactosidase [Cerasicoccus frondis]
MTKLLISVTMLNPFLAQGQPLYGADYNPDQWLDRPDILERDIELMKRAHCTSMTLGVFSWTSYEPREGVYDFSWLEEAFERLHAAGIRVILATPTGSKPMWLSEAHPEVRRVNREGAREPSGERHNHCPSSPVFREKSRNINRQLAKRFGQHPALILWHLNNEISGECFCNNCLAGFRTWLKERYGSLEAVNAAWWAAFWNHTVTDWEQITPFDMSVDGQQLDWRRYMNELHVETLQNEMVPLRELTPHVPCTTNFMSTFDTNDYYRWSKVIDIVSNDRYPLHDDREESWRVSMRTEFINALMRGMADGKSWMQMECSPSSVNWWRVNKLKRPGVHFSESMQYLAHGADAIHYFQWRKGRGGCEKYHGAVVDHDGSADTRVFADCEAVGAALEQAAPLAGEPRDPSPVGIVYDWESKWAIQYSNGPRAPRLEYPKPDDVHTQTARDHYNVLARLGISADITFKDRDWSAFKCLVLPSLYLIDEELVAKVKAFAEQGGVVIGSYLTGYVNQSNCVWLGGLPGAGLRELFGVWNEEIDYLFEEESNTANFDGESYLIQDYVEVLHAEAAEVIATHAGDFYAGKPVVTCRQEGAGYAYYYGARIEESGLLSLYRNALTKAGVSILADTLPQGVTFQDRRESTGKLRRFIFNFTRSSQVLPLEGDWVSCCGGEPMPNEITLDPYEVRQLYSV